MGGWEHKGPWLLLTGPVLHRPPTPKNSARVAEGSGPGFGSLGVCFPAAVGARMQRGPVAARGRAGLPVQPLPSPPLGAA